MRAAFLLVALTLNTCTTANVAEKGPVEMETIASGSYAADESERKAVLATTEADYRQQWQALIGQGEIPAVDFDKSVVVFLLAGTHNTGGWGVVPESVHVEADGTAVVEAKIDGPPPGGITTQAITHPWAVVAIHSREVTKVRW